MDHNAGRWIDRVGDNRGGLLGASINVIVGAGLGVFLPVVMFVQISPPVNIVASLGASVVVVFLEIVFVRKLRDRLANRRGHMATDESNDGDR